MLWVESQSLSVFLTIVIRRVIVRFLLCCVVGFCLTAFSQVSAQELGTSRTHSDSLMSAVARLKPDKTIKVHLQGFREVRGVYQSVTEDSVYLVTGGTQKGLALTDVKALWERGRATRTGLLLGGIVVGAGGAVLGAIASAIGGQDEGGSWALIGGGLGLASGAVVGGVIGAGVPKWRLRFRSPNYVPPPRGEPGYVRQDEEATAEEPHAAGQPRIGGVYLQGGYTINTKDGAGGGSVAGRLGLVTQLGSSVTIGPEGGYYRLGTGEKLWHVSGVFRVGKFKNSRYLYGTFELGMHRWINDSPTWIPELNEYSGSMFGSPTYLGYGFGGGVRFLRGSRPLSFGLEGRWQSNLSRVTYDGPLSIFSVMASVNYSW